MMIVVFGDKQEVIHKTHLHFQPRMPCASGEIFRLQYHKPLHLAFPRNPEGSDDEAYLGIIVRELSLHVGRWSQGFRSREVLVQTFPK